MGIVERSGTWYSYSGSKLGQGRDNAKKYLSENEPVFNEIEAKILQSGNLSRSASNSSSASSAEAPSNNKLKSEE